MKHHADSQGFSITLSRYRRRTLDGMSVDAIVGFNFAAVSKCGAGHRMSLPNNARALFEVHARGFDNAIVCDMLGNVAEVSTSNIFMAKGRCGFTLAPKWHISRGHYRPARD